MKYSFFYDESEHSRKINKETILSNNFAYDFVSVIVGCKVCNENAIFNNYLLFENTYKEKFTVDELKSEIIKQNQIKHGFAGLNKLTVSLLTGYFEFMVENNIYLYYSTFNKIEYVINQLFSNYHNSPLFDMDNLRYSITKILVMYEPIDVYEAIYKNDGSLVYELKKFIQQRIAANQGIQHKQMETSAFQQALLLLDDYKERFVIDWDYGIAFIGFKKYLTEKGIEEYSLIIDREGNGKTLYAAKRIGIGDAYEVDSKNSVGIRIADMLAGLVSKFLKNIVSDLKYNSPEEVKKLKLLSNEWFNIDENKLNLYKMFKQIIVNQNDACYKSFSGNYADSFLYFICLLNYFSGFKNIKDYKEKTVEEHQVQLNNLAVANLNDYFMRMHSKLPIEPISPNDKEFYYNQRGAKCYFDYTRQGYLDIPKLKSNKEHGVIYRVLSVGFFGKNGQPCVTIYKDEQAQCLLLPKALSDWAFDMVALSNSGGNFFPSEVEFGYINGRYYAEIL